MRSDGFCNVLYSNAKFGIFPLYTKFYTSFVERKCYGSPNRTHLRVGRRCRDNNDPTPLRLEENALVMAKYLYTVPIHTVWRSETGRFIVQNGPFRSLKRTVSQAEMACIRKPLAINGLQLRSFRWMRLNYFDSKDGAMAPIATIDSIAFRNRYSHYRDYRFYSLYRPL